MAWYCAISEPYRYSEKVARQELAEKGYRCFFPEVEKWVKFNRNAEKRRDPLFGRYLFVEVDLNNGQDFATVGNAKGVSMILKNGDGPIEVPGRWIEMLITRQMSGAWDFCTPGLITYLNADGEYEERVNGKYPVGAQVIIMEGKYIGELGRILGYKRLASVKLKNGHVTQLVPTQLRPAVA